MAILVKLTLLPEEAEALAGFARREAELRREHARREANVRGVESLGKASLGLSRCKPLPVTSNLERALGYLADAVSHQLARDPTTAARRFKPPR
jgi:hypothetical protein